MRDFSVLLLSRCQLWLWSEKCPPVFCIAERQRILSGTPDLTRQPQTMSREQASAENALGSAVS